MTMKIRTASAALTALVLSASLSPIAVAQDVMLVRDVKMGETVGYADVAISDDDDVAAYRRAMERANV